MPLRSLSNDDTQLYDASRSSGSSSGIFSNIKRRPDPYVWGIYCTLVVISLIECYCASSRQIESGNIFGPLFKQAGHLGMGLMIMLVLQQLRYQVFYKLTWIIACASALLALSTFFIGESLNGAARSISLMVVSLQPSELMKLSAVLVVARVLGDNVRIVRRKFFLPDRKAYLLGGIIIGMSGLLVWQGMTNAFLLFMLAITLMIIGGMKWRQIGVIIATALILGGTAYTAKSVLFENIKNDRTQTRENRITDWWKGNKLEAAITSDNRQEQFSYIAQANGGVMGVGLGKSREASRLPLAFSDYIFAIIVEDSGLVGGLIVLSLYIMLLARAGTIFTKLKKLFPRLVIVGMGLFIIYQAIFHIGIVTGFFPVSGQTLPFISMGGSSIIMSSVALGIMLSVMRSAERYSDDN